MNPTQNSFLQRFPFQSANLSIPLNKYKSYVKKNDYVVLGVERSVLECANLNFSQTNPGTQISKFNLIPDSIQINLSASMNIDSGLISFDENNAPVRRIFCSTQREQFTGSNQNGLYATITHTPSLYAYIQSDSYIYDLKNMLNQSYEGHSEQDMDLKDNEILIRCQQLERIDLEIQVNGLPQCSITLHPGDVVSYLASPRVLYNDAIQFSWDTNLPKDQQLWIYNFTMYIRNP